MPEAPAGRLKSGEILSATAIVRATPEAVYAIISDVERIPEWSSETVKVTWTAADRFRSWNRRRLGVWRTSARVTAAVPGSEFTFVVETMGEDWTEWSYRLEPGAQAGTTLLTERFTMCTDLPLPAFAFELLFLFVRDRRADLEVNLRGCVERIADIVEGSS